MLFRMSRNRSVINLSIFAATIILILGMALRADAFWVRASGGMGSYPPGINGDGTDIGSTTPVWTLNAASTIAIDSGGDHNMILKSDGSVWCWGINNYGELGDGTTNYSNVPVQVADPTDPSGFITSVIAVSAGVDYSLALKSDGTVWGWGTNRYYQLGNTSVGNMSLVPVQVMDQSDATGYLTGVKVIQASTRFAVVLKENGTVFSWGSNYDGMLGDGTFTPRPTAIQVIDPSDTTGYLRGIKALACGDDHVVALSENGTIWSWGFNNTGQLGDPSFVADESAVPIHIDSSIMSEVAAVSADYAYTLVLRADGTIWGCGENSLGELGDGTGLDSRTWVKALTPPGMKFVATSFWGGGFSFGVGADGSVWSWGCGSNGALGNGDLVNQLSPVRVVDLEDPSGNLNGVLAVSCTAYSSLFMTASSPAIVSSIEMTTTNAGRKTFATAMVTVVREDGTPLAGAVVSGHWSGLTSDSDIGTTGADGKVALNSNQVRGADGTFTFTIDTVVIPESSGLVWDQNHSVLSNSITYP